MLFQTANQQVKAVTPSLPTKQYSQYNKAWVYLWGMRPSSNSARKMFLTHHKWYELRHCFVCFFGSICCMLALISTRFLNLDIFWPTPLLQTGYQYEIYGYAPAFKPLTMTDMMWCQSILLSCYLCNTGNSLWWTEQWSIRTDGDVASTKQKLWQTHSMSWGWSGANNEKQSSQSKLYRFTQSLNTVNMQVPAIVNRYWWSLQMDWLNSSQLHTT